MLIIQDRYEDGHVIEDAMSCTYLKLVVVLGMHRSGTSVITKALECVGVELGNNLMEAAIGDNDLGFFEDLEIVNFNDELLAECNKKWYSTETIQGYDVENLIRRGFLIRAVEMMRRKLMNKKCFGYKDPRSAKLLPFWSKVYEAAKFDTYFILALRNPLNVVRSLQQRDGIECGHAYYLWADYITSSLTFLKNKKFIAIDYDHILDSPREVISQISEFLHMRINLGASDIYEQQIIKKSLRHWSFIDSDLAFDNSVPHIVHDIYSITKNLGSYSHSADLIDLKVLEGLRSKIEQNNQFLKLADAQYTKLTEKEKELSLLRGVTKAHEEAIKWAQDLELELKSTQENFVGVTKAHEEAIKWAQDLELELKSTQENFVQQDLRFFSLESNLSFSEKRIQALLSSNSWKLTYPLREIARWRSTPKKQQKKYLDLLIKELKFVYLGLIKSEDARLAHKRILKKILPSFPQESSKCIHVAHIVESENNESDQRNNHLPIQDTLYFEEIDFTQIICLDHPKISIIIPIFGNIKFTMDCLKSIEVNSAGCPDFEIIVVDDCSPDFSVEILNKFVKGIKLVKNKVNQGFIRSCNNGAGESSGEYLYFLNNDTKVCPGWLEALLRTFNDFPGAGLIGSMLLYPDGVLQEAGGIVWKDGSAWNYGKYQDASLPKYNYAREVDYCSGASIVIPRFLFDQLSGFDQYFNPAYCEDCDIALKIRNLGYRVIYQPLSKVIHFEGITSGTDVLNGVKSYQIQNTKKLYQRWKHILDNYQPNGENLDCATDRRATRRVLVLDHCTPTPDQDAGSVIALNLMLLLREMDFQVTFIPEDNLLYMPDYTVDLQRVGIEALYYPYITSVEQHLQEAGNRYDLVFFIRPTVVQREIHLVRKYCSRAKLLYETCDMHHLRMFREAKLFNDPEKFQLAEDMKKLELLSIQAVDATILRSTVELELLRPELPNSCLRVFPLIMNSYDSPDNFGYRKDIIFVGGYQHTPNIDAVKYFVESIMPIIRSLLPGISFCAVGSNPPPEILGLNCKDVKIVGYVKDIQSYFNSFRVSIVPLRYGAGIKGKIGTAMSAGLPVVATNLAVEGMGLTHYQNIIVADSPEIFAREVFNLYTDIDLWKKIRSNGYEFSRFEWGPEAAYNTLKNILSDIDLNVESYRYPLSLCK